MQDEELEAHVTALGARIIKVCTASGEDAGIVLWALIMSAGTLIGKRPLEERAALYCEAIELFSRTTDLKKGAFVREVFRRHPDFLDAVRTEGDA